MSRALTISRLVAATPATRDRYVDFLRAFSIAVVVFGHWLMAVVYERDGRLEGGSALDLVPGLWVLTWVLQVMPIFFFVGGFSNQVSWDSAIRKGEGYRGFLTSRIERLMKPTAVFIVTWLVAGTIVRLTVADSFGALGVALETVARPLWFLAVYVLVTALAPVMLALHRRFGARVPAVLAMGAVFADVARIDGELTAVGYLNFAFVWLFAHQLGFFYADGAFDRGRRFALGMAATGISLLVGLVSTGIYAPSMVGTVADKASNNTPPSVCLIALTLWLVGLVLYFRAPMTRWLSGRAAWSAVVAANSMIMTVFLWHLTALLIAVVVLAPIGLPQPDAGSVLWWVWRPLWLALLTVFLVPFVLIFHRFERPARSAVAQQMRISRRTVAVAVGCLVAGLGGLAGYGFDIDTRLLGAMVPIPFLSAALALAGHRLLTASRRRVA